MEERRKSHAKVIVSIVLVLILLAGVGFSIWYFLIRKDNKGGGVQGTETELACYAINKVNKKASSIYDAYAKASAGNDSVSLLGGGNVNAGSGSSDVLSLTDLIKYFEGLRMCNTVPVAMDFVINSSNSDVYTNRFEIDKTYMAREKTKDYSGNDVINAYYYTVKKNQSLINCLLTNEHNGQSMYYLCQIEYDFQTDKLISAKTIVWMDSQYMLLHIDYVANEFTAINYISDKTFDDLMDNGILYSDVTMLAAFYRGNIVRNINEIEFEDFVEMGDVELVFNTYCKNFALGIEYEGMIDYDNFVINNSFIDAMEYSVNKLDFSIRENPNNKFEYQYISTWMEYQDAIKLLDDTIASESLVSKPSTKQLLIAYKNRLQERGEYSYKGDLAFEYDADNYLDIIKDKENIGTYIVSVITGDEGVFECVYQYVNGALIVSSMSTGVEFEAEASQDGTYAIITCVNSKVMSIDIPEEIEIDGIALPVKELSGSCYGRDGMILNVPASVTKISAGFVAYNIREVNVHADNTVYASVDGVLYNKTKTELISYPEYKAGESFTIPEGVVSINNIAFIHAKYLSKLTLAATVGEIDFEYTRIYYLSEISVAAGSSTYTAYDGVLYSADGKTLVFCPPKKAGVLTVKNGTEEIDEDAFEYCEEITELNLPASLVETNLAMREMTALTKITVAEGSVTYSSHDGILYSADGKTLIFCPANKGGVITVKEGTEIIDGYSFWNSKVTQLNLPNSLRSVAHAFGGCVNLHTLTLPDSVTNFDFGTYMKYFHKIVVSENNAVYAMDENNFVYNKNKTKLYFVPGNILGVVRIPSHVTSIATYAFNNRSNITEIIVPSSVVTLDNRAFGYYSGAEKITFEGTIEFNRYNDPFSQAYDLEEISLAGLTGDLYWEIFDDCENFHTITYAGTKAEFESYIADIFNLNTTVTVHCSDGDLTYTKA